MLSGAVLNLKNWTPHCPGIGHQRELWRAGQFHAPRREFAGCWAISKGSSSHCEHVSLISYSIYFWKTQKVQNPGQPALGFINLVTRLTRCSNRLLALAITTWNNRPVNKEGAKAMPYPRLRFGEMGNSIHLQVSHPKVNNKCFSQ